MGGSDGDATIAGFVLIAVALFIYFIPAIHATSRKHRNAPAIFALNLFLGWTLIGWVCALVWSLTAQGEKPNPVAAPQPQQGPEEVRIFELQRYAELRDKGVLTSEEFDEIKAKLLSREG